MKTLFLTLALFSGSYCFAQTSVDYLREVLQNEKTEIDEDDPQDILFETDSYLIAPETWDVNFDNLLNSWHVTHHTNKLNHEGYQENIPTSDSVYMERLSKLPNIIELPYNGTVRGSIDLYVERRRDLVEYMLGMETFYFPMIEETLDRYGLPLELKYLVIIESAMNPTALSRAGASGLWQFMLSTGRSYGLEINSLVDDRRDPIKSTDAACRFLKDLYSTYGDWNLAIAAYNCGGGNVNKAIRRAGGKTDYWTIYPYLPKETRSYVPLFIAANYVMNYYAYHQLYPVQTSLPLATDTVMVTQMIHFDQITDVLQMDKEILRALNPQYKMDIIPGNFQPQILKLPALQAYAFVEKENEIVSHRTDELFTNRTSVQETTSTPTAVRQERIHHKVRSGETVITIADRYGVTAADIRKWNGLKSNRVITGYTLVLFVNNGGYLANNTATSTARTSSAGTQSSNRASAATVRYKVKPGDSFYTIAQKYPGYSHTDLMKLNKVTKATLKAGQYILVPKI